MDQTTPSPPQSANQNAACAANVSLLKNPSSEVAQEGLYDPPWETSAVSKFKVIGRMRAGSAGSGSANSTSKPAGKERTPPPVSPKTKKQGAGIMFGEVSMTEVPIPGRMELRNVHSLERSKHKKERQERQKQRKQEQQQQKEDRPSPVHSYSLDRAVHRETSPGAAASPQRQHSLLLDRSRPASSDSPSTFMPPSASSSLGTGGEDDSLLASITDTLQKQSKYGSDALLSPPTSRMSEMEPQKPKKIPNEVRRSSRGELEKIRAAHRRDPPPPPMGGATSPVTRPTHSSPTQGTKPTPTRSSPQGIGNGTVANNRMSPQGTSTAPAVARTSPRPQAYMMPVMSSHKSPPTQKGTPPTNSAHHHQNWTSPSHAASAMSPKHVTPHHSSQILISSNSINGASSSNGRSGQAAGKRRMFSGRPRMAASLDELQTDPSTQVTYDASSKSHIFRSLV